MKLRLLGMAALAAALPLAAYQAKQPKVSPKEQEALMQVQTTQRAGDFKGELAAITNVLENFVDTKYKPQLLDMAMDAAQRTGDSVQVATWYERTIANDPNDIVARVVLAEMTASQIRANDLDKAETIKKVNDLAHKALDLIQSGGTAPALAPPDGLEPYKKELAGRSWTAMAMAASVDKKYADAIADYQKGLEIFPNSIVAARLAKAYVDNRQYDDAIAAADKAMAMADATPQVKNFAQAQKDFATKMKAPH
jgi:tetratricopeptide (TPR) repeat protein